MQFEIPVLLMLAVATALGLTKTNNISLIISLPLHYIRGPDADWKRGLEILPGAHVAVNGINEDSSILSEHNLQLITVDSGGNENEILQQFVDFTFHQSPLNIVGISGFLSPKAVSILSPLVRRKGMLLTAATEYIIQGNDNALLALNSPSAMVNVLLRFMERMNWENIGLIAENMDTYFFRVAEILLQTAKTNKNITISPYIELVHIRSAINEIINHSTRIVIISLRAQKAIQLICVLYQKGLVWPDYAWIFHSYRMGDFLDHPATCDMNNALDGIFTIESQPQPDASEAKLISGITFSSYYHQYLLSLATIADEYNTTLRPVSYTHLTLPTIYSV